MEHGLAVSPHCPCGQVYTAALVSGRLTGTLLLLPSRDPVEHISSAALNLNGGSELPTRDYMELDDAAAFGPWITSCCMTAPPVAPCRPSGSFLTSARRQRPGPPSSQTFCFTFRRFTIFQIVLPGLILSLPS